MLRATEVVLNTNLDGIHCKKTVVGYINEDPFVVLTAWLNEYIISGYDDEFYPINYSSFKNTITLNTIEDRYSYANIIRHSICDLTEFERFYPEIRSCKLTEEKDREQTMLLQSVINSFPVLEKAVQFHNIIDIIDIIDITKISPATYLQTIVADIYSKVSSLKEYTDEYIINLSSIISYIMKKTNRDISKKYDYIKGEKK